MTAQAEFPTGGIVRELLWIPPWRPIRCDSGTDSTVWMREEAAGRFCCVCAFNVPPVNTGGFFIARHALYHRKLLLFSKP